MNYIWKFIIATTWSHNPIQSFHRSHLIVFSLLLMQKSPWTSHQLMPVVSADFFYPTGFQQNLTIGWRYRIFGTHHPGPPVRSPSVSLVRDLQHQLWWCPLHRVHVAQYNPWRLQAMWYMYVKMSAKLPAYLCAHILIFILAICISICIYSRWVQRPSINLVVYIFFAQIELK